MIAKNGGIPLHPWPPRELFFVFFCYSFPLSTYYGARSRVAQQIRAKELCVTHFGGEIAHNVGGKPFAEIAASVGKIFGKQPIFAKDFLTLEIDREGSVEERAHDFSSLGGQQ